MSSADEGLVPERGEDVGAHRGVRVLPLTAPLAGLHPLGGKRWLV